MVPPELQERVIPRDLDDYCSKSELSYGTLIIVLQERAVLRDQIELGDLALSHGAPQNRKKEMAVTISGSQTLRTERKERKN